MSPSRKVEVKKYGITRYLMTRTLEQNMVIDHATKGLHETIQGDGQSPCHRLRVQVVAYIEVDTLPAELNAGIIPEHVHVVTYEESGPTS